MKRFLLLLCLLGCYVCVSAQVQRVTMGGYIGGRVDDCIQKRVLGQNTDELIEPFLKQDEVKNRWASEFWGKWVQGAIASYQYNHDEALYAKIKEAEEKLMNAQLADGYIGDYDKGHQLKGWDVWGRKYTLLGLLKWYRLSGDKRALKSACRLLDYTMTQIGPGKKHIYETGYYRGMPPCSILEPVMYLYNDTKDARYLEFAKYIVEDGENGHQLIAKADVPVQQRFPLSPGNAWWGYENGQKAYEMMSCYIGMLELYRVTGEEKLFKAAETAFKHILAEEINICGSGAASECWYGGAAKQHIPTIHTMETCVTFTWMQFCERMLEFTNDSKLADQIERTMYNALMSSMKDDGSQIVKYVPLEGFRREGEHQCDVKINCCNANAPRAFAMIPRVMYRMRDAKTLDVNLFIPSTAEMNVGKVMVKLQQETEYPKANEVVLRVDPSKPVKMALNIRIPEWSSSNVVEVNGVAMANAKPGCYCRIDREWKQGDKIRFVMNLGVKLVRLQGTAAIERGPVVFARDSRFDDGDVDECLTIPSKNGDIGAMFVEAPQGMWMTLKVPVVRGGYGDKQVDGRHIRLCDFASAGNTWDERQRYRVWMPLLYNPSKPDGGVATGYW